MRKPSDEVASSKSKPIPLHELLEKIRQEVYDPKNPMCMWDYM